MTDQEEEQDVPQSDIDETEVEDDGASQTDVSEAGEEVPTATTTTDEAVEATKAAEAAFVALIANFKLLYDTAKSPDPNKSIADKEDRKALFDKIFDTKLERYLNGERAGGYEEVLAESIAWADNDSFIFRAFRYKRLAMDSFDSYVRFANDKDELIIQSKIYFEIATAKAVKLETRRLQRRKKLPGQTPSSENQEVWPGLTERVFAQSVHPLPREVGDQTFLGSNTKFSIPVVEKSEMIRYVIKHDEMLSSSMSSSRSARLSHRFKIKSKDVFRLYDENEMQLADGAYWEVTKQARLGFHSHRLVLFSSTDEPLCLCMREVKRGEYVYMIYGREAHPGGDAPLVQETIKNRVVSFHAWFRVRVSKKRDLRLVYVWNSNSRRRDPHFEPLFRLVSPPAAVSKTSMNASKSMALQLYEDKKQMFAVFSTEDASRPLSDAGVLVAPGVDPGMVLAVSVCLNQIRFR